MPLPRRLALLLALGLSAAGLAGCLNVGGGGPTEFVAFDEAGALRSVNAFRAQNGLGPVSRSATLEAAAEQHSQRMAGANSLSHSLGGALPSRLRAAGYSRWWAAAENIGMGYTSYGSAITGWINSPGHRRNLLNPSVTQAGIAAAQPAGRSYPRYWTIILAAPR